MDTPFAAQILWTSVAETGQIITPELMMFYSGHACRVPETPRELRGHVHLLDFSDGLSADIFCDHCNEGTVARIETRLAAVGL
jgi:hypothetical protein